MDTGDWIGIAALGLTLLGMITAVVRYLVHNATDPIAAKVATHDTEIGKAVDLATSTNIKVSRIEGYLAGMGRAKLPDVAQTVEIPQDGEIVTKPLIA